MEEEDQELLTPFQNLDGHSTALMQLATNEESERCYVTDSCSGRGTGVEEESQELLTPYSRVSALNLLT